MAVAGVLAGYIASAAWIAAAPAPPSQSSAVAAERAASAGPPADAPAPRSAPVASMQMEYGRFGTVSIYRPSGEPRDVVLFISGDGGWNLGVVDMAQRLTGQGAIVAGIDIRHYLHELDAAAEKCVSVPVDLENLSHVLQSKLALKTYLQPTLVGYSSGAALVYAALVQAPEGLFKGALSLGFCPELDLKKPLCKGSGLETTPRPAAPGQAPGVRLLPAAKLDGYWSVLQGEADQVCAAAATQSFVSRVPGADLTLLPKVGHGYSVEKNWAPQFDAAYARITAAPRVAAAAPLAASVADLPLTLVPAAAGVRSPWFGVLLSGDGGWVGLDKGVAAALAARGIPIVGWDSLKYFWSPRTPDGAAADLARVIRHFAASLDKSRVVLIGYSQGADTLPFMVNRLPAAAHGMLDLAVLLGIEERAQFEFHFASWVSEARGGRPIEPELARWSGPPYLCLYGDGDANAACERLTGRNGTSVKMPGGHHFDGDYAGIAAQILERLPASR